MARRLKKRRRSLQTQYKVGQSRVCFLYYYATFLEVFTISFTLFCLASLKRFVLVYLMSHSSSQGLTSVAAMQIAQSEIEDQSRYQVAQVASSCLARLLSTVSHFNYNKGAIINLTLISSTPVSMSLVFKFALKGLVVYCIHVFKEYISLFLFNRYHYPFDSINKSFTSWCVSSCLSSYCQCLWNWCVGSSDRRNHASDGKTCMKKQCYGHCVNFS